MNFDTLRQKVAGQPYLRFSDFSRFIQDFKRAQWKIPSLWLIESKDEDSPCGLDMLEAWASRVVPQSCQDARYGQLLLSDAVWEIIHTPEMRALHGRGQSSLPSFWSTTSTVCSTHEHALGTGYLAALVLKQPEIRERCPELVPAALVHDFAAGPYRHYTDEIMRKRMGITHEQRMRSKLANSETGRVLEKQGYSLESIAQACEGKGLAGQLLASKVAPDVDTLDNVDRFNRSQGLLRRQSTAFYGPGLNKPNGGFSYSPEHIAKSFRLMDDGALVLRESAEEHIMGYYAQRQLLYSHVNYEYHLPAEAMLLRALQLADDAEEIGEEFYDLEDATAREYLLNCNPGVRALVNRLDEGRLYRPVFREASTTCTDRKGPAWPEEVYHCKVKMSSFFQWGVFADAVAGILGLPREDVSVHIRVGDRGFRQFTIPLLTLSGELLEQAENPFIISWLYRISVYASRDIDEDEREKIFCAIPQFFYSDEKMQKHKRYLD